MTSPEISFENGCCKASIFRNNVKVKGEEKTIPMVTISRNYLDKKKEWQKTNVYRLNDLPKLIAVAMKSYDYLTGKKTK